MRLVDGVMYMNMGQMTNDKFMKFDLSDPANLPPGHGRARPTRWTRSRRSSSSGPPSSRSPTSARRTSTATRPSTSTWSWTPSKVETLKDLPAGADVPEGARLRRVVRRRVPDPPDGDGDGHGGTPVQMEAQALRLGRAGRDRGARRRTRSSRAPPSDLWAEPAPGVSGRACCRACPSCWSAPGPSAAGCWSGWRRAP